MASLAAWLDTALSDGGVATTVPKDDLRTNDEFTGYSRQVAASMHNALASLAGTLEAFRAGIREETSPIQFWPHHFDLSMIWLPGPKIPGEDPANEEYADKQMNFGFVFGDAGVSEPYLYVTAYPLPEVLPKVSLPQGTTWQSEGFSGAVTRYADLLTVDDPAAYLLDLWTSLMQAARPSLTSDQ